VRSLTNILFLIVFVPVLSQVRQERDYSRSFALPADGKVEVINKYGEVIVRTWDSDSVKIDVLVRAEGRNSAAVNKSMNKVNIKFRKVGTIISAITELNSGGGVLGNLLSDAKGVVGNNKLQINYEVWLPQQVLLSVENKFGDVYLSSLGSRVNLDVSHGDIKAENFSSTLSLKHSYGKAYFGNVSEVIANLRGSEIYFEEAKMLNVESGSSEIRVDKIIKAQFNSRNDKIHLLDAREVLCEGFFTNLTLDKLKGSTRLDFSYGDIYLSQINKNFKSIDITGKSTDINLVLNQASYIKTLIKGQEDRMILPNSMLLLQKQQFEDERISLSGDVGNTNTDHSQLIIDAEGGKLIVSIKETSLFTERD